jgi:hypothetical protein
MKPSSGELLETPHFTDHFFAKNSQIRLPVSLHLRGSEKVF